MSNELLTLEQLILDRNPFDRSPVVRSQDIWEQHFPDVPTINGDIFDAILQGIEQIKNNQRPVLGVTIKAERGLGKSHLISRVRAKIQEDSSSFFIYALGADYSDLDDINQLFLGTLALSLKQIGSHGISQWQELAVLLVKDVVPPKCSIEYVADRFAKQDEIHLNGARIENFTNRICEIKPYIENPDVIKAILWTLSPDKTLFAINWLSGKELSAKQADAMDLPPSRSSKLKTQSLELAIQILNLLGEYKTTVICFDEIEPASCNNQGLTTPQVVALLAKNLYDRLKRIAIITTCFPVTWQTHIEVMPRAESVVDRIAEKHYDLKPLNGDNILSLISCWLQEFYVKANVQPPTPYYPFQEEQLRALGKERPVVRKVLLWCAENWPDNIPIPEPTAFPHKVDIAYREQMDLLASQESDLMDDSDKLGFAIELAFKSMLGQTIENVTVNSVEPIASTADRKYLNFKILGIDAGGPVQIGVAVRQESGGKFMSAALKRLTDYHKFNLSRGCLVRSKKLNPKTEGEKLLNQMLEKQGGEWVVLKFDQVKPLLAISMIYRSHEEYEFTPEQVIEFIQQQKIAEDNALIREILSAPSGQIPEEVVDEDSQVVESSTIDNGDANGDLGADLP
jgi:hypothetical protein